MEQFRDKRLSTLDEKGRRTFVIPQEVKGYFTTVRRWVYSVLILFYLVLPWIYVDGKQWVLLDIPKRTFHIFGKVFYGHDFPVMVFGVLSCAFFIAFLTSKWGRLWCGYACPQTVFIDHIYRFIERIVEGSSRKRQKLQDAPMSWHKLGKLIVKNALYLIVTLHIVHSFIGYFVGTRELVQISMESPANNPVVFTTMLFLTGLLIFNFTWFREQFCIVACPYGRFQSILMDESSLVVRYNYERGEPRSRQSYKKSDVGDCVDCGRCVKVCPTAIDIREGTQMECLACGMCADACNEIMTKLKKPTGLISYRPENYNYKSKRSLIYFTLMLLTITGLFVGMNKQDEFSFQVLRGRGELVKSNDFFTNHFILKLKQGQYKDHRVEIYSLDSSVELIIPDSDIILVNEMTTVNVFTKFNRNVLVNNSHSLKLEVRLFSHDNLVETSLKEITLVGAFR